MEGGQQDDRLSRRSQRGRQVGGDSEQTAGLRERILKRAVGDRSIRAARRASSGVELARIGFSEQRRQGFRLGLPSFELEIELGRKVAR